MMFEPFMMQLTKTCVNQISILPKYMFEEAIHQTADLQELTFDPLLFSAYKSTLLHSERPKLYTILAFLSATG